MEPFVYRGYTVRYYEKINGYVIERDNAYVCSAQSIIQAKQLIDVLAESRNTGD